MDTDLLRIVSGKNRSALIWAERAHRGQERASDVPYLLHPIAVAITLAGAGADRNVVCAGCLHDVVEDTDVTIEMIRGEFGDEVARLVAAVTKSGELKGTRLEEQAPLIVARCRGEGPGACALKAADLLTNLTDLVHGAELEGVAHWHSVFGAQRATRKLSHYLDLAERLECELDHYPLLAAALRERSGELRALLATHA